MTKFINLANGTVYRLDAVRKAYPLAEGDAPVYGLEDDAGAFIGRIAQSTFDRAVSEFFPAAAGVEALIVTCFSESDFSDAERADPNFDYNGTRVAVYRFPVIGWSMDEYGNFIPLLPYDKITYDYGPFLVLKVGFLDENGDFYEDEAAVRKSVIRRRDMEDEADGMPRS